MTTNETASSFHALDVAHLITEELLVTLRDIRRFDRNLADQLQRAATSVVLNLAEGNGQTAGNRNRHFHIARGSLFEVRAALRVATTWGYTQPSAKLNHYIDRVSAMTHCLLRPK